MFDAIPDSDDAYDTEVVSIHMDLTHSGIQDSARGLPCLSNEILIYELKKKEALASFLSKNKTFFYYKY